MRQEDIIKELDFEKFLSVLFIICSILNIYGDYLEQEYIKCKNAKDEQKARKIFITALLIVLLIYFYYLYRNWTDLKKEPDINKYVRFFGTILIIIGINSFIYYQSVDNNAIGTPPI